MAYDAGVGVVEAEAPKERCHAALLGVGAGVGGEAAGVEAALVADAYGVGVVVPGVSSYHRLGTTGVDLAVAGDVVVVADGYEAAGLVAGFEGLNTEAAVCPGGGAVDDNVGDLSHDCLED